MIDGDFFGQGVDYIEAGTPGTKNTTFRNKRAFLWPDSGFAADTAATLPISVDSS